MRLKNIIMKYIKLEQNFRINKYWKNKNIVLGHININGMKMKSKDIELEYLLKKYNIDIIFLQETKLEYIRINDYFSFDVPCVKEVNRKRGMCILIKRRFCESIKVVNSKIDYIVIELNCILGNIVFINIYLEKSNLELLILLLERYNNIKRLGILRDFNVSFIRKNKKTNKLIEIMKKYK